MGLYIFKMLMQKVRCFDTDKVGKESYFFLLSDFTLYEISNQILLYLTLRRIRCTLRKSKIPDRMRGCWDRKVTGTRILVHILCLRAIT